jgi:transcription-repair coupling factor (superfamily II helicase)
LENIEKILEKAGRTSISGVPEGMDAIVLGRLAAASKPARAVLHIARDDARVERLSATLAFFAPGVDVLRFPAWDTLPYDRVSPHGVLLSRRAATLSDLVENSEGRDGGRIVLTTVNAVLQRVPPQEMFLGAVFRATAGGRVDTDNLMAFLTANGYFRTGTVREPGEFAIRGGIIDLYPPGAAEPLRLDLFGNELEAIRAFDPVTQRTTGERTEMHLGPVGEILLDPAAIERFRSGYRNLFGAGLKDDALYESISAGRKHQGMEHWLPLFHDGLDTLLDYLPTAAVTLDHQVDEAVEARIELIADYYQARLDFAESSVAGDGAPIYRPVPPADLFLDKAEWDRMLAGRGVGALTPFVSPDGDGAAIDAGGRGGETFAAARTRPDINVFDEVRKTILRHAKQRRRILIAAYSAGSRERLGHILEDHAIGLLEPVSTWDEAMALPPAAVALVVFPLENGFTTPDLAVITEQDILGDRMIRPPRRGRKSDAFLTELSSIEPGDLVVHVEHGVGRYDGLATIEVTGAPHDCVRILYDGGDRLFLPVENLELLTRYGSEDSAAQLDRLGGAGWQARKARVKKRIKDIADGLIAVAATRALKEGIIMSSPGGLYDEFCARFPYAETEDQDTAIADTLADIASGRSMDRLICGDVGFGKTEVALRAAYVAVLSGAQVAVVVPTTLLARQHYRTFLERFQDQAVRIEQLSRLVPAKRAVEIKEELETGAIDIIIGTHALLGKSVRFANLGLLVVDEEQHFGVTQKERLKTLRANVHVLTLTATPIPRTLQMALSGVREMSLIATPPVDRLAVRTFVLPYDPVVIREAIMREIFRGGQVFYVCPRIEDLPKVAERLVKLVPEVKVRVAHGRIGATELEDVMSSFYDGAFDLLLSTSIIESGLDIPAVNTIIIHRADMFGLSQLYQLRGRVGRSKTRAYAYLTLPPDRLLTPTAQKRLEVMQTLDTLGAGFTLASHDLDIRGAGNLLGEEQSGHIREVGIELYQHMLEEAVAASRQSRAEGATGHGEGDDAWTPQIAIGTPVMIPEEYVSDLSARLGLYRRIAALVDRAEIDSFAAELVDRFGTPPPEVENLLEIVAIKRLCLASGVDKVDAGPKGAVLSFYKDRFSHPERLVDFIQAQVGTVKLRPDHKLVYRRQWSDPDARIKGITHLMKELAKIAA